MSPGFYSWNLPLYEILYNQCFIPGTALYRRRVIRGVRVLLLPSDQRGVSFPLPHLFVFGVFEVYYHFYSPFHDAYCLGFCVLIPSFSSSLFLLLSFPSCQPFSAAFLALVLFVDLSVQVLGWVFALLVLILGMIFLVWF